MKITVLYVGTSLLAPLKRAEAEINEKYHLGLSVAAHNCTAPLDADSWAKAASSIASSKILFIIHVTDGENAARIIKTLESTGKLPAAVIAFNCMPELMRLTRMGKLDFARLMTSRSTTEASDGNHFARKLASWMADFVKARASKRNQSTRGAAGTGQYLNLLKRLPAVVKFVPAAGKLRDLKNYLLLFCYFLQPTSNNIRSMLLQAISCYALSGSKPFKVDPPETMPVLAAYHPDAPKMFEEFAGYKKWYGRNNGELRPDATIGLLLMRPQVISDSRRHYDALIRALEAEGLAVLPVLSTLMDNRQACGKFFIDGDTLQPRISQVVSLTGFSFVGGPAMNDSDAAVEFLSKMNVPLRSLISLDVQTIESWRASKPGLNPIQTAMQVAIPEIDGATEPFVFGGLPGRGYQPEPLEDRCRRIARRVARWNRLKTASRDELKLALVAFCFPPDKGNIGTAADLDVFPSFLEILSELKSEGYDVVLPKTANELREMLITTDALDSSVLASTAYRMGVDEYRKLCPYVDEIEREWGAAPGTINSNGSEILIQGVELGNVFIGVQPTFGYEGDPMRMLASESAAPHHGFMGLYTYIERVFQADAVVHVGTHGALEFMPGKQVGLSGNCWPDRLIGEVPNIYLYSVNNPAEGAIAKRRSYAEIVSYLTPPIENAGLYKGLASLKEQLTAYRQSTVESERATLFQEIQEQARALHL